jgi:rhodanese-related sulfurtransferase
MRHGFRSPSATAGLAVVVLTLTTAFAAPASDLPRDASPAFVAMAAAGTDHVNDPTACPGVIDGASLWDQLDSFTVIDLRSESSYLAGHVPGARHSSLATLVDDLAGWNLPDDEPIVFACYTGQSSGYAQIAAALLGFEHTRVLKWGMAGWNCALAGPWDAAVGDALANPETENQNGHLTTHPFPDLPGDPDTIVAERVAAVLAEGYSGLTYAGIVDDLEHYFVINAFGVADYEGEGDHGVPGHIPGAFQFTPHESLGLDQMLASIPADQPVVVYGWTGMHSAQLVAYLRMLGYDAYNLTWGVQALFHGSLTAHRWNGCAYDFPLEIDVSDAPEPASAGSLGLACAPNPFNPRTTVRLDLPAAGPATVRVYDLAGRLVRTLASGHLAAGRQAFVWNGDDAAGRTVASGVYAVRVEAAGRAETRMVTLLE